MQSYYSSILQRPVSEQKINTAISNSAPPTGQAMINDNDAVLMVDIQRQEQEPLNRYYDINLGSQLSQLSQLSASHLPASDSIDVESLESQSTVLEGIDAIDATEAIEAIDLHESLRRRAFSTSIFNFAGLFSPKGTADSLREEMRRDFEALRMEPPDEDDDIETARDVHGDSRGAAHESREDQHEEC
jgi:hypothetical protein